MVCETPSTLSDPGRIHDTVSFRVADATTGRSTQLSYLNGGFPTTFVGQLHCVSSNDISPTIALMVGGAVHASEALRRRSGSGSGRGSGSEDMDAEYYGYGVQPLLPAIDGWVQHHGRVQMEESYFP